MSGSEVAWANIAIAVVVFDREFGKPTTRYAVAMI